MLKDITLGQYFPGDSFIHRLDPRTKILIIIAYVVMVFLIQNFVGYIALALFLALCVAVSGISPKYLIRGLKPILVFIVFTGIFNLFLTPGEEIWRWGFLKITVEGVRFAADCAARLAGNRVGRWLEGREEKHHLAAAAAHISVVLRCRAAATLCHLRYSKLPRVFLALLA